MSTLDFREEPELTEEKLARYEEIDRQEQLAQERYDVDLVIRQRAARLQRDAALDKGNAIRLGMADVKREIREGALSVGEALHDPRSRSVRTSVLIQQQRGWGPRRADVVCSAVGINPICRVGDLTDRQRNALAACLTEGDTP